MNGSFFFRRFLALCISCALILPNPALARPKPIEGEQPTTLRPAANPQSTGLEELKRALNPDTVAVGLEEGYIPTEQVLAKPGYQETIGLILQSTYAQEDQNPIGLNVEDGSRGVFSVTVRPAAARSPVEVYSSTRRGGGGDLFKTSLNAEIVRGISADLRRAFLNIGEKVYAVDYQGNVEEVPPQNLQAVPFSDIMTWDDIYSQLDRLPTLNWMTVGQTKRLEHGAPLLIRVGGREYRYALVTAFQAPSDGSAFYIQQRRPEQPGEFNYVQILKNGTVNNDLPVQQLPPEMAQYFKVAAVGLEEKNEWKPLDRSQEHKIKFTGKPIGISLPSNLTRPSKIYFILFHHGGEFYLRRVEQLAGGEYILADGSSLHAVPADNELFRMGEEDLEYCLPGVIGRQVLSLQIRGDDITISSKLLKGESDQQGRIERTPPEINLGIPLVTSTRAYTQNIDPKERLQARAELPFRFWEDWVNQGDHSFPPPGVTAQVAVSSLALTDGKGIIDFQLLRGQDRDTIPLQMHVIPPQQEGQPCQWAVLKQLPPDATVRIYPKEDLYRNGPERGVLIGRATKNPVSINEVGIAPEGQVRLDLVKAGFGPNSGQWVVEITNVDYGRLGFGFSLLTQPLKVRYESFRPEQAEIAPKLPLGRSVLRGVPPTGTNQTGLEEVWRASMKAPSIEGHTLQFGDFPILSRFQNRELAKVLVLADPYLINPERAVPPLQVLQGVPKAAIDLVEVFTKDAGTRDTLEKILSTADYQNQTGFERRLAIQALLKDLGQRIHKRIYEWQAEGQHHDGVGASFAVALVFPTEVFVVSLGGARAYLWDQNPLSDRPLRPISPEDSVAWTEVRKEHAEIPGDPIRWTEATLNQLDAWAQAKGQESRVQLTAYAGVVSKTEPGPQKLICNIWHTSLDEWSAVLLTAGLPVLLDHPLMEEIVQTGGYPQDVLDQLVEASSDQTTGPAASLSRGVIGTGPLALESLGDVDVGIVTLGGERFASVPPKQTAVLPIAQAGQGFLIRLGSSNLPDLQARIGVRFGAWDTGRGPAWRIDEAVQADSGREPPRLFHVQQTFPPVERSAWQTGEILYPLGSNNVVQSVSSLSTKHVALRIRETRQGPGTSEWTVEVTNSSDQDLTVFVQALPSWRLSPPARTGLEEVRGMDPERFFAEYGARLQPAQWDRIPNGLREVAIFKGPLYFYPQGEPLTARLEDKVRRELPADAPVRVVQVPFSDPEQTYRRGVIFLDRALEGQKVPNPLGLPVMAVWLADLRQMDLNAIVLEAFRNMGFKPIGYMTVQDANGPKLVVFL